MTSTMAPPIVPNGLRRTICTQTSVYQGRVRGSRRTSAGSVAAGTGATVAMGLRRS